MTTSSASNIDRKNVENIHPLSPMQQGLLFHSLLAPTAGAYVPQIVLTLRGAVDAARMAAAWQCVLDRHPALRSGFYWEQRDEPFQVVQRNLPLPWVEQDWSALDADAQKARLEVLIACNRSEPFDLRRPPLMRLNWIRLGANRHHLVWCYHHLVLDGWSAALLLQEVLRACAEPASLPPPPRPYSDFIAWLSQQDQAAALDFWRAELAGLPPPPELPLLRPRPTAGTPVPAHTELTLSTDDTAHLQAFVRQRGLTLNTLVQGALGLLLRRYGNDGDIVFGTTVAGRPAALPQATSMIGLFINTVPVRLHIAAGQTVEDWLRDIQARRTRASEHDHVPLRELQAQCNEGRPLFDCLLVIESYPTGAEPGATAAPTGISLDGITFDESTHFPLTLQVAEGSALRLAIRHDTRQADTRDMRQLLNHMAALLRALAASPQARVGDITLLSADECAQQRAWNDTAADWPRGATLADLFEWQVEEQPQREALSFEDEHIDYSTLNTRANRVAHALQARGIGAESIVALHVERSLAMMVALLAIQKAGAAWLPLDSGNPPARRQAMLDDARPALLLYDGAAGPAPDCACPVFDLSDRALADQPETNPSRGNGPTSAAYVIYTSGSTGTPKGVINTQAGIVNRLHWMQRYLQLMPGERVLQKTPLGFDVSVWEVFWPLLEGATLVIARPGGHLDREYLSALIARERVNVLHFVPAMLADFLEQPDLAARCASLRDVVCSGEALGGALARRFHGVLPKAHLHNLYGPTEAAVDVSAWVYGGDDATTPSIPIGRPIDNIRLHLLDADDHEVPVGGRGRLHIGGIGVARGYLARPALNAERFLPDAFVLGSSPDAGDTLYDSGDIARRRPDGAIEYIGRADDQFKLRGVRIEAGEVEAALTALPGVHQAVVRLWPDLPGGSALVAYVVPAAGVNADVAWCEAQLHTLRGRLPDAMVPGALLTLETLPLNASGKPDRAALPRPRSSARTHVAARSGTEMELASIWQEALRLDAEPGVHDSFFELGGHSLVATRIVSRVHKRLGIELALRDVFEFPTLEGLATRIDTLRAPATAGGMRELDI